MKAVLLLLLVAAASAWARESPVFVEEMTNSEELAMSPHLQKMIAQAQSEATTLEKELTDVNVFSTTTPSTGAKSVSIAVEEGTCISETD